MAQSEIIRARIDGAIKDEASIVLASMGLTPSDAFRMMMVRIAREKALPFALWVPNADTLAAFEEARSGKLEPVTLDELQAVFDAAD